MLLSFKINTILVWGFLLSFLFVFYSCNEQVLPNQPVDEGLYIELEAEVIGHQFIYLKQHNVIGWSNSGYSKLFYDTVPIDSNSPYLEVMFDFTNHPKIYNLKPNTEYYFMGFYNKIQSPIISVTTLAAEINCTIPLTHITGDLSASQPGFNGLHVYSDRLSGILTGDLTNCTLRIPDHMDTIDEGIYTTINHFQDHGYEDNRHNIHFFLESFDKVYYAQKDQPVRLIAKEHTPDFFVEFCDVIFEDGEGNTFVMSGYLK